MVISHQIGIKDIRNLKSKAYENNKISSRDGVHDESHVSLITEMYKVMYDTDKEEALVTMLKDMGDDAKSVIEEYLKSIPSECLQDYEIMI